MHDSQLEDQLRGVLRAEGDGIPLTITTAELERRLAARRRATGGRRLSLVAAAVAAIVVGSIVAAGNGWLKLPAVGTVPSPSVTTAPVASPSDGSPAGRAPLGSPGQAILVRPIGASWTTPDSLEVIRFDPADQTSEVIATIPGPIVPAGKWVSTVAKPIVSATGWLAIPLGPGPDSTDKQPAIVIVDLLDPTAAMTSIAGATSGSWNGDDTLAFIGEDGSVRTYSPTTGDFVRSPIQDQDPAIVVATQKNGGFDPIWTTAAGSLFLAQRETGATTKYGIREWGALSIDGTFAAMTDLPPVYQRTGLERLTGVVAHSFEPACTGSGNLIEARCTLVETDATRMPIATRVDTPDFAYLADFAWADDGRDAWLLFDDGAEGGSGGTGDGMASLSLSRPDGSRTEYSRMQLGGGDFAILGVGRSSDGLPIVAIGSRSGSLRGFVAARGGDLHAGSPGFSIGLDGTAWFAGWAGQQPDYDPD